jgi:hypothetical protein
VVPSSRQAVSIGGGLGRPSYNKAEVMFEVGKNYTIRMWEDGEDGGTLIDYDNCEVIEISMPLVKFKQPSNEDMIVNTASLAFVQATLETDEEPESENSTS